LQSALGSAEAAEIIGELGKETAGHKADNQAQVQQKIPENG
jgi:hypothetical protein